MISFTAILKRFEKQGEKTGWTYIEIPPGVAAQLKPDTKQTFRVKGRLDAHVIQAVALLPMGGGAFILAVNGTMRKALRKAAGDSVRAQLEWDRRERELPEGFMDCLEDEPAALEQFNRLSKTHKGYYIIWINTMKTESGRAKRMAQAVTGLAKGLDFSQLMQGLKEKRDSLNNQS